MLTKRTYRPSYMSQSPVPLFQRPNVNSLILKDIRLGQEVKVLNDNVAAWDPLLDRPYPGIRLCHVEHDGVQGYINARWLRE